MRCTYTSDNGYGITMTDKPPYILEYLDGNNVAAEANSVKAPGQDGATTYSLTRSQRGIQIAAAVLVDGGESVKQALSEQRDYLAKVFDPMYFGLMQYYSFDGDRGKQIRCRPTAFPVFDASVGRSVKFKVGFLSDISLWEEIIPTVTEFGYTLNNWTFPYYLFPTAFSFAFVTGSITNTTLYNVYPVLTVYNSDIAVEIINKTTGKSLKFNRAVGENQRIVVDTKNTTAILEEQINSQWIFRENVMNRLTLESDIAEFYIIPGENVFDAVSPSTKTTPILNVYTHLPVAGV